MLLLEKFLSWLSKKLDLDKRKLKKYKSESQFNEQPRLSKVLQHIFVMTSIAEKLTSTSSSIFVIGIGVFSVFFDKSWAWHPNVLNIYFPEHPKTIEDLNMPPKWITYYGFDEFDRQRNDFLISLYVGYETYDVFVMLFKMFLSFVLSRRVSEMLYGKMMESEEERANLPANTTEQKRRRKTTQFSFGFDMLAHHLVGFFF